MALLCLAPAVFGPLPLLARAGQPPEAAGGSSSPSPAGRGQPAAHSDLDILMATVLQRRDENWRRLHDYVLREKEAFALDGPGRVRLYGSEREFTWYMRDGFLVRSPLRFDKVALNETERRKYEDEWLRKEKEREEQHAKKLAEKAERHRSAEEPPVMDVESFMREGGEPRFISEAYFLEFKFEPGNYYLAGREKIENRDVLKIEYYPTNLFNDEDDRRRREERKRERERRAAEKGKAEGKEKRKDRDRKREDDFEEEFDRKFNKVAVVTLWVDPAVNQIVKFTFENVDFGFLPGRWLLRVGEVRATMVMGQPFPDVWLPRELVFEGDVTLAAGTFEARYTREYYDYRQGEVRARIRHYGAIKEEK